MEKYKILAVGPLKSGKTAITNFLSGRNEHQEYQPTVGVRITEFDVKLRRGECSVDLWDVSGDQKYESCWPAICKDADGVMIVYNRDNRAHEYESELWHEYFVKTAVGDENCIVFSHSKEDNPAPVTKLSVFENIPVVKSSFASLDHVRPEFEEFIEKIMMSKRL